MENITPDQLTAILNEDALDKIYDLKKAKGITTKEAVVLWLNMYQPKTPIDRFTIHENQNPTAT